MQEKQMTANANMVGAAGVAGTEKRVQEFVNFKMPKDLALVSILYQQKIILKTLTRCMIYLIALSVCMNCLFRSIAKT